MINMFLMRCIKVQQKHTLEKMHTFVYFSLFTKIWIQMVFKFVYKHIYSHIQMYTCNTHIIQSITL